MALSILHEEGVALSIPHGEGVALSIPDGEKMALSISHGMGVHYSFHIEVFALNTTKGIVKTLLF